MTVDYSLAGATATAAEDFESRPGTLVFAPGETSRILDVPVIGDSAPEANEPFFVFLSNPACAKIDDGYAEGRIVDDDDG